MATKASATLRCSFCGRLHGEVAKLIAGPGIYICDGCVQLCVEILAGDTPAEPPTLPEWTSMSDDELLQRIPIIAASSGEYRSGTCDRVLELRERGVSLARIGAALGMTRQSAWERFSRTT